MIFSTILSNSKQTEVTYSFSPFSGIENYLMCACIHAYIWRSGNFGGQDKTNHIIPWTCVQGNYTTLHDCIETWLNFSWDWWVFEELQHGQLKTSLACLVITGGMAWSLNICIRGLVSLVPLTTKVRMQVTITSESGSEMAKSEERANSGEFLLELVVPPR